ncbi:MAG: hypothetical protein JKY42_05150 [Flavobacteriales bacterium]|nr:hypothetical protein [Flavobacteriales bacterium]
MDKYIIKNIKPLNTIDNGLYLVILHANDTPPHLGLIYNRQYFSLTVKGQALDDIEVLNKLIQRKQIKTLFFRLSDRENELSTIMEAFVEKERVKGNITCLLPIKTALSHLYSETIASAKFIFEVLPELYGTNDIEAVFHVNMENEVENGSFAFSKYSMRDILLRIRSYETEEVC